ncbi:hypothetical protein [Streptomyces sp. Ru72]|uniref:hypothetical protein n=1 Tax=Streptomyces sp. Ru72 TaxID=2080747 RepID=UPI0015E371C6|nr:hypothetical protein [Streptomyces sp. Ru72]
MGGDDAGSSDVITTCVSGSDSDCVNRVDQAESHARNALPARLDATYDAIRAKAPNAEVVVLRYPHVYTLDVFYAGFSDTDQAPQDRRGRGRPGQRLRRPGRRPRLRLRGCAHHLQGP